MKAYTLAITLLVFFFTVESHAVERQRESKLRLSETEEAVFMGAAAEWRIWRTSELVKSTQFFRAASFVHRFYIQKSDDPEATLVHIEENTRVRFRCTVMPDRTFVLCRSGTLSWYMPDGGTNEHPKHLWHVAALYQDGIVIETKVEKTYFVPFKGHSLNVAEKIALGENCYRSGDKFAWIVKSTLHFYNLKSKERSSVRLKTKLHPTQKVTAFDGETVIASLYVFDARTGQLVGDTEYSKLPSRFTRVFAVHNRVGYYVAEDTLFATDLASPEKEPLSLLVAEKNPAHFHNEKGIQVWKEGEWTLVEWLNKFQTNDSKNAEQRRPADAGKP